MYHACIWCRCIKLNFALVWCVYTRRLATSLMHTCIAFNCNIYIPNHIVYICYRILISCTHTSQHVVHGRSSLWLLEVKSSAWERIELLNCYIACVHFYLTIDVVNLYLKWWCVQCMTMDFLSAVRKDWLSSLAFSASS